MQRKPHKSVIIRGIHQIEADVKISIHVRGKRFSLNCIEMADGRFAVKRGRFLSEKMPSATITEIYEAARKWTVSGLRT